MKVINRSRNSPVRGVGDKLTQLPGEVSGGKVTGRDQANLLPAFARNKVSCKRGSSPPPCRSRKHLTSTSQ